MRFRQATLAASFFIAFASYGQQNVQPQNVQPAAPPPVVVQPVDPAAQGANLVAQQLAQQQAQRAAQQVAQQATLAARLVPCVAGMRPLANDEGEEVKKQSEAFEELGFGGGYAARVNLDDRPRVDSAEVVGGVVRVSKDRDVQFGPVLELHKFFGALASRKLVKVGDTFLRGDDVPANCVGDETINIPLVGIGPVAAVRLGDDDQAVQSFGLGVMFGFRKDASDNSLNIGLLYVVDLDVKTLGDGIEEGKALPTGETTIRFKETQQYGLMFTVSVGW